MNPPRKLSGFTLLESLVTLVIVALIVAVLMQASAQAVDMRARVFRLQRETRLQTVQAAWFRESFLGMTADFKEGFRAPAGDQTHINFHTLSGLVSPGPVRVEWRLEPVEGGVSLVYQEGSTLPVVAVAGPLQDARLEYAGVDGVWRRDWNVVAPSLRDPVSMEKRVPVELLPRAVRLVAQSSRGALDWRVAPPASPWLDESIRPVDLGGG